METKEKDEDNDKHKKKEEFGQLPKEAQDNFDNICQDKTKGKYYVKISEQYKSDKKPVPYQFHQDQQKVHQTTKKNDKVETKVLWCLEDLRKEARAYGLTEEELPEEEKRKSVIIKAIIEKKLEKEKKQKTTATKHFEFDFESLGAHWTELNEWKEKCVMAEPPNYKEADYANKRLKQVSAAIEDQQRKSNMKEADDKKNSIEQEYVAEMSAVETMQKTLTDDTKLKIKEAEESSLKTVDSNCEELSATLNGDKDRQIGFMISKALKHQMKRVTEQVSEEKYMEAEKLTNDIDSRTKQEKTAWKSRMEDEIEEKVTVKRVECMKEHEWLMREHQKSMDELNSKLKEDRNNLIKKYNKRLREIGLPPEIQKLGKSKENDLNAEPKTTNDFQGTMNGLQNKYMNFEPKKPRTDQWKKQNIAKQYQEEEYPRRCQQSDCTLYLRTINEFEEHLKKKHPDKYESWGFE